MSDRYDDMTDEEIHAEYIRRLKSILRPSMTSQLRDDDARKAEVKNGA